ncbi:MAG TPA: hypothetical protein VGA00_06805 [Acidiferrobacterales bacterium]
MHRFIAATVVMVLAAAASPSGWAEKVSKEQIKGLDEQVQEIKTDALGIAAELGRLEEKLLYPSNTQLSVFIGLAPKSKFRLDAVEIQIDGKAVAHYLYAHKELEALQGGGVQRIYTGNMTQGEHALLVSYSGKSAGGGDLRQSASFRISKDVGPKIVGVTLAAPGAADQSIAIKDW